MRHLTAEDVHRLLPPARAVEVARATALTSAAGAVDPAERIWHRPGGMPGSIGVMPCHLPADDDHPPIFTTKLVGVFPGAEPSVNGVIAVQDARTGAPLATVDAASVTLVRTAAASALSVELLARPGSRTLAVVGAGAQAEAHVRAIAAVRPIDRVRIANRDRGRAEQLAATLRAAGDLDVIVLDSAHEAAIEADVISACTGSPTAVLHAADVAPGAHVTAIGAYTPDTRELAADLVAAAVVLVVDDREAAAHEAGDLIQAEAEGAIGPDAVLADLAELCSGAVEVPPRHPGDITVYKSVGTSAMDAVAVRHLLAAAGITA